MDEQTLKSLEERLTRLEAALSQASARPGGFTAPGGAVVDPAPWGGGGVVVDPAPYPWRPHPWRYPFPHPIADPAPDPFGPGSFTTRTGPITGPIGDPPPVDISRLSAAQLQASLHNINAERARLDGLEEMINKQLEQLNQG